MSLKEAKEALVSPVSAGKQLLRSAKLMWDASSLSVQ